LQIYSSVNVVANARAALAGAQYHLGRVNEQFLTWRRTPNSWDRVQERRKAKKKWTAKTQARSPKYLLSSLLKCAECESSFTIQSYYQYGCAGHKDRGPTVCGNSLKVSRKVAEQKILAGLQGDLFTQEGRRSAKIVRILPEKALLNLNHPLAGKPLLVTLQIVTIENADKEATLP
jgi:hypothetical protein